METGTGLIDLSWAELAAYIALLLAPALLFQRLGIGMNRKLAVASARMIGQLALVGFYLEFLFELNDLWLNATWLLVMLVAANGKILSESGLSHSRFILPGLAAVSSTTLVVAAVMIYGLIHPTPLHDARYVIPVTGMILGNCLRGNILALQRFYQGISADRGAYQQRLAWGATRFEAVQPWLAQAMRMALSQHLAMMATIGLVSLPGMMTGQVLGGAPPMAAVKYQIAIMIAIFISTSFGAFLNLWLTLPMAFDPMGNLREDVSPA